MASVTPSNADALRKTLLVILLMVSSCFCVFAVDRYL
jgi:hypothetical protein